MTPDVPRLSPHLTLAEFTATQHRAFLAEQARPPTPVLLNARRFAVEVFEPARTLVGPLHVTSGWRCPELNRAIGGAWKSRHLDGLAADVVPLSSRLIEACEAIARSPVPFDQMIYEYGRWLHLGGAPVGSAPRRMALMVFSPGRYLPWDAGAARRRGSA